MRIAILLTVFMFALSFGQQNSALSKQRVAVLPSVGELEPQRLDNLTDKVREIATKILPMSNFLLLKQDAVIEMIGTEDYFRACKEGTCIGELAKKANANYGARCDVFKVNNKFALKFELYSVKDEAILETFTEYNVKDFFGMLAVLDERLPAAFRKMLPSSSITMSSPTIQSGIGNIATVGGGMQEFERSYLVNLNTDPQGAILSFNGTPIGNCSKTPCKVELPEGNIRIVAALEKYETADTTVSIKQNNQKINIKLKANFGILEIKPSFKDGIGNDRQWDLTINGRAFSSMDNKLSPGNYEVKLSHECYEDISFNVGINKGKSEVFDMQRYAQPKQGVLVLSTEKDDEPVSESVFASGKRIGETPFSGSVPVCAEISIGKSNDKVDVKLLYNQTVRHKHKINMFNDSRDGKNYKTVKIGTQTWMAENLNYNASGSKCYGEDSIRVVDGNQIKYVALSKNDIQANCDKYGRLYDWNTAMKACPKGWHLPTNEEWKILRKAVGGDKTAGKRLKAISGWNNFNGTPNDGEDTYGFAALPGGRFYGDFSFVGIGKDGTWWTASDFNAVLAWNWKIRDGLDNDYTYGGKSARIMYSVRCLQDD